MIMHSFFLWKLQYSYAFYNTRLFPALLFAQMPSGMSFVLTHLGAYQE
jgi:hypothetical protein